MKTRNLFLLFVTVAMFFFSCREEKNLTEAEKESVKAEILSFMKELIPEVQEPMKPDEMFHHFLKTDDLAVATGGNLLTNANAVLDTMKVHMAAMQKEIIKDVDDKIYVITKEAAVISTSKMATITFKSGDELTVPFALTILLVKKDGEWKIAHYHN